MKRLLVGRAWTVWGDPRSSPLPFGWGMIRGTQQTDSDDRIMILNIVRAPGVDQSWSWAETFEGYQ